MGVRETDGLWVVGCGLKTSEERAARAQFQHLIRDLLWPSEGIFMWRPGYVVMQDGQ